MKVAIENYIEHFPFSHIEYPGPWGYTNNSKHILNELLSSLPDEYLIKDGNAVHHTAIVEEGAVLKLPCIVEANAFIASHAYLREGVYVGKNVKIGAGCELKSSFILDNSAIAHFNYIGNSIIGTNVNFEAGSIAANHHNEREDKEISIFYQNTIIKTGQHKFGSLVGDDSRIGANAVLSPGTLLLPKSIVKRLELIEQVKSI